MNHSAQNGSISSARQGQSLSAVARPSTNIKEDALQFPTSSRNWLIYQRYVRNEFDICKLLIEEVLQETNGYNEFANYILGFILRHEGKIQESMDCFRKCHSLNPKQAENIKQVAKSLYLLGRHQLAIEAYLEAERYAETPDWNIFHNLGECYIQMGEMGKGREYLHRAVQLGKSEMSYRSLARLYDREGETKRAVDIYNTALEQYAGCSELAVELGLLHLREGDFQRAVHWLGYALAHDAANAPALLATGTVMQMHGESDTALAKYKIAAKYLPESAALWNNIGMCFFSKKKFIAAISCLKRANYLCPLDWRTLYNLGLVYLTCRQYASSFTFLSACLKLRPKHAPAFMLLGLTLMHLEDLNNAGMAFEQAVKLDPDDPAVRANYAGYWVRTGHTKQALDQLNTFNQLAQQIPHIGPQVVELVRTLTSAVTQDIVPKQSSHLSGEGDDNIECEAQVESNEEAKDEDTQHTQHLMQSDEV